MQQIAIVRLSPGEVGYFDEITRIHLTISNPRTAVFSTMNTAGIRRAVNNKTLILEAGSLEMPVEKKVEAKKVEVKKVEEVKIQEVQEVIEFHGEVAETIEETVEPEAEEKPKKATKAKKTSKKKKGEE